jgi:hypothetical protein
MASSVRRLCLDATLGRYWRIGPLFGWTSESAEFPVSQKPAKRTLRPAFVAVPADCVLAPFCNRDRAPDVGIGADDVLQTTRLVAFDFASTRTGTLAFVEGVFTTSSFESRMLNCRLSEKHLNRRATRLVILATRHDKASLFRVVSTMARSPASSTFRAGLMQKVFV